MLLIIEAQMIKVKQNIFVFSMFHRTFFFFIDNGEENKRMSAADIAKVDNCFLLASVLLSWAYHISGGLPGLALLYVGLPEIRMGAAPVPSSAGPSETSLLFLWNI